MTESDSPRRAWPRQPHLGQLKNQAKDLLRSWRAGDPATVAEVESQERTPASPAAFALVDAQRVLARSYGFASWPKLKRYVETLGEYQQTLDDRRKLPDDVESEFLRLACITYFGGDHPAKRARAREILTAHPSVAKSSIHAAAASGDVETATALLDRFPESARTKGGPLEWEPLLYAAFSRVEIPGDGRSSVGVARLLIDRGADPNAGFLWDWGGDCPCLFTALTGVLGLGEADVHRASEELHQPPHRDDETFARLLLDAGADPNDDQGLYNRMQYPGNEHLELLFEYGLGTDRGGPWFRRFFDCCPTVLHRTPQEMLTNQLRYAAKAGYSERVRLLVEHGVDVNRRGRRNERRSAYELALVHGHSEIAEYLTAHGSEKASLSPTDELAAACRRRDEPAMRELLTANPNLIAAARDLLIEAAESNDLETIRSLVDCGAELGSTGDRASPLHHAALAGNLRVIEFLVERGADLGDRDPLYRATPLGWAAHTDRDDVVDWIVRRSGIFDAVRAGRIDRVRELIEAEPTCAQERDPNGQTALFSLRRDTRDGPEMIDLLVAHGVDVNARDARGLTALDVVREQSRDDLADALRRHGAIDGSP